MNQTSATPDMLQMFVNIAYAFPAIFGLVQAIFALIGLVMFGQALFDIYALNNEHVQKRANKSLSTSGIITKMIVAVVLTSLIWFIDVTENTLMGADASSGLLMYQSAGMTEAQKMALSAIMGAFALVGYIAFGRGWMLLDKHFNGSNTGVGASIWHIIGGTILVYMDVWLPKIGQWTGFDLTNILLF